MLLACSGIERARFRATARRFSVPDAFVEGLLARHAAEPDHPNPEGLLLEHAKALGNPLARLDELQRSELLCHWGGFATTARVSRNRG